MIKPCGLVCVAYPYACAALCPIASVALLATLRSPPRLSSRASAAIAGVSTSPACTPRPAPNTSHIASSLALPSYPRVLNFQKLAVASVTVVLPLPLPGCTRSKSA